MRKCKPGKFWPGYFWQILCVDLHLILEYFGYDNIVIMIMVEAILYWQIYFLMECKSFHGYFSVGFMVLWGVLKYWIIFFVISENSCDFCYYEHDE